MNQRTRRLGSWGKSQKIARQTTMFGGSARLCTGQGGVKNCMFCVMFSACLLRDNALLLWLQLLGRGYVKQRL